MSKLQDKPGRKISIDAIVDRERGCVQILRHLHDTKGCMVDSGNMGWVPLDEFRAFLERIEVQCREKAPTLIELWGLAKREEQKE